MKKVKRSRRNPNGATLKETLPVPLYELFSTTKARYAPKKDGLEEKEGVPFECSSTAGLGDTGQSVQAVMLSRGLAKSLSTRVRL